ncbi:PLP-dependent transferase [Streptomyces sp. JH14]|uniref:O-acetylhomoserine aminocarboxypropyltransferase/cysteine synthase family protein n=1 Tax=Streptomyces sp. JH14 TaxID=2793630 RepID=UPI0023F96FB3|nr:PLP-dependent transferase [Streptomyces sp. JH14]MDF6045842.1 PLP-dependent transferase [Streptomyces sp. JH14]
MTNWAFETRQVHSGAVPDPATGARAVPIHQTTSYVFRDTAHAAAAFELADLTTHAYTRLSNPTTAVAEERIAALEGGSAAVAVASGQAATSLALLNLARAGDHIVVHSTTKFLSGHGTGIGGVVVDSGRFDFGADPDRWPGLTRPDPTYNGLAFWDSFSDLGLAYALRLRTRLVRDLGPAVSPFNSFLLLQGLETLSLRIERHVSNTQSLAEWLEEQPQVTRVHYASLPSSPWQTQAKRYLPRGAGAVLAFELAGGLEAGRRFVEGVRLFSHLANIGDVRSLVIHPASTTHAQLDAGQQIAAGVTPGLVRLSVGTEGVDDLIADLEAGLRAAAV